MSIVRKQKVTLPALSFKDCTQHYVQITSEIKRSERVEEKDDKRQPANTCRCRNLKDGEEYILICPAMMVGSMRDTGMDYIGKYFEINVTAEALPGKDYKGVTVYEIEKPVNIPMRPEDYDGDPKPDEEVEK